MKQLTESQLLNLCSKFYIKGRESMVVTDDENVAPDVLTSSQQVQLNDTINAEIAKL